MRITYKNTCYILEDLNVHGNIIDIDKDSVSIQWKHVVAEPIVQYNFIGVNKITSSH